MSGPAGTQGPPAERHSCAAKDSRSMQRALSGARPENSCFSLDSDLHGCRQTGSYLTDGVVSGLRFYRLVDRIRLAHDSGTVSGFCASDRWSARGIARAWQNIICNCLDIPAEKLNFEDILAVKRVTITSPGILRPYRH